MNKVFVITGATATGKSAFGAEFAKKIGGEVVSADSMQVYRFMDIGTAKQTEKEMSGIPHHMIDVIMPWEDYSVARYVQDAASCVDDIHKRGKPAVIVGGTGLYIDSLLSGRTFSPRGDDFMRKELELEYDDKGGEAMLQRLRDVDPVTALRLHINDKKRIVRALEVFMSTGKTITQHDDETRSLPPRFEAVRFSLTFPDREKLYERIDRRVDTMIEQGLEAEVRELLDMGVPADATSMQAIGYKEVVSAINGEMSFDEAIEKIKQESRRYAKRQLTWIRSGEYVELVVDSF